MGGLTSAVPQSTPVLVTSLVLSILSLAAIFVGWRGRRVGDHPHCRKCGFDLFGSPKGAERCSECGAELDAPRAVVVGVRARRGSIVVVGGLMLLMFGALSGINIARQSQQIQWVQYYSLSWLLDGFDAQPGAERSKRLNELQRRIQAGELSGSKLVTVTDRLLTIQGDSSKPWDPSYETLFRDVRTAKEFTPEQLTRLLKQSIAITIETRPRIRKGAQVPIGAGVHFKRMPFLIGGSYHSNEMVMDGRPLGISGPYDNGKRSPYMPSGALPGNGLGTIIRIDDPDLLKRPAGDKSRHRSIYTF